LVRAARLDPVIRRAVDTDHTWIAQLAAEVYQDLGEYGTVMPQWLAQPGVVGWIDEERGERRGFAVLGFYQDRGNATRTVADLLAIGVVPKYQRRGIGTRLLAHVIGVVAAVAPSHGIPDLRLTVAHTNVVGQRWYARSGFRVVDGEHGTYANGQRAIRMARQLP
jgi:ribosomal protein S18 acetylase RimI-like enzyme